MSGSAVTASPQEWDRARADMVARQSGPMRGAITRWEQLNGTDGLSFDDYAGFILTYPGFPQEQRMRTRAENALARQAASPASVASFFDRYPPLTNNGRARHALALQALGRPDAVDAARAAWRAGTLDPALEGAILTQFGGRFGPEDHAERLDALLWQGDPVAARRQSVLVPASGGGVLAARLSLVEGRDPSAMGIMVPAEAMIDPGYVFNLVRAHRAANRPFEAAAALVSRGTFRTPARDPEAFVGEMLRVARAAGARQAAQIAGRVDDLFAPGTDISRQSFRLRDDYTSLMWLGGTQALWNLGDGAAAAPLFYRYGAAAQTPQTRTKGFYWAGRAAARAGQSAEAQRHYELAAAHPDRFYGQLSLQRLGRSLPPLDRTLPPQPSDAARAAFRQAPLTLAVAEVARDAPWNVGVQFYRAMAERAVTAEDKALVAEFAREIGRRDLAVILADAAGAKGLDQFVAQGFPTLSTPAGTYWTMVHAIARQESQFAQNAISHAGARGLMQLMPGTAREQAERTGMTYLAADLLGSPDYNIRLGDGYFQRMLANYGGSYVLAVAAYNAGPGNVNRWLRANGDPRTGAVDWIDWIERIPFTETRTYVHRVLENAVVYEHLHPDRARVPGRPRMLDGFLR
ncbi:lytic transglycosylase domain-containing protein [Erythrobacteraceae bacterium CFH 75059]|nr:lytic transglycosylase domain-containing protein [Erythrobacteraceae bacterium CFH 75059]